MSDKAYCHEIGAGALRFNPALASGPAEPGLRFASSGLHRLLGRLNKDSSAALPSGRPSQGGRPAAEFGREFPFGHRTSGGARPCLAPLSQRQGHAMKLNAAQLERTATQLQAEPIPDDHPLIPRLNQMFGDHTPSSIVTGLTSWNPRPPNWRPTAPGWGWW